MPLYSCCACFATLRTACGSQSVVRRYKLVCARRHPEGDSGWRVTVMSKLDYMLCYVFALGAWLCDVDRIAFVMDGTYLLRVFVVQPCEENFLIRGRCLMQHGWACIRHNAVGDGSRLVGRVEQCCVSLENRVLSRSVWEAGKRTCPASILPTGHVVVSQEKFCGKPTGWKREG